MLESGNITLKRLLLFQLKQRIVMINIVERLKDFCLNDLVFRCKYKFVWFIQCDAIITNSNSTLIRCLLVLVTQSKETCLTNTTTINAKIAKTFFTKSTITIGLDFLNPRKIFFPLFLIFIISHYSQYHF